MLLNPIRKVYIEVEKGYFNLGGLAAGDLMKLTSLKLLRL